MWIRKENWIRIKQLISNPEQAWFAIEVKKEIAVHGATIKFDE